MQIFAPAKVNLSLRVVRRRDDGFHEIDSLMTPISLADELALERGTAGSGILFECDDRSLPEGDDNLVVKAARLFFEKAGLPSDARIRLTKKIPHGAGLGGGSSDAASTLMGLNQLFQSGLSAEALASIAATFGSDIPFFLFKSAAVCRGRGEIVTPEKLWQSLPLLLLKPDFSVPTPEAYRNWASSRELPDYDYGPQTFAGSAFFNDLERPVFQKFPFLAEMKAWLCQQPEVGAALMSGSGSTMMAVLTNEGQGEQLAERAKAELDPNLWTCEVRTTADA
jgi:4-diphosphocytidyl-2-C-methyl-D-erythritol kinase